LRLLIECTSFCNIQSRARTHAILVIDLYELLGNPTTWKRGPWKRKNTLGKCPWQNPVIQLNVSNYLCQNLVQITYSKTSMSGPFDVRYNTDIFNMHLFQARNSLTSISCVSVIPHTSMYTLICLPGIQISRHGVDINCVEDLTWPLDDTLVSLLEAILSLQSLILSSSLLFNI
jgi:hypothetical protein